MPVPPTTEKNSTLIPPRPQIGMSVQPRSVADDASESSAVGPAGERRAAHRWEASTMKAITGLRLSPCGGDASLVNISESGILAKSNTKLQQGAPVTVVLDGTFSPSMITGRVARCVVADIDSSGVLWYHVGIAFNKTIVIQGAAPAPVPATAVRNRW
jgi:hypothetical protein